MSSSRQSLVSTPEAVCVRVLQRCLAQNPECVELRVRLALCQVALGDPGAAEESLRSAVRVDPGHLPTRLHLGWLLDLLGRRGEAAGEFRAVLAQDPTHAEARRQVVQLAHEPQGLDDRGLGDRGDGPDWWAEQVALHLSPGTRGKGTSPAETAAGEGTFRPGGCAGV